MFAVTELCRILLAQDGPSVNLDEGKEKEGLCPVSGLMLVVIILEVILKEYFISPLE